GSTIPVHTQQGTQAKRDGNGQIVMTRYTPEFLEDAVSAAHGVFIDAAATDKAARIRGALSMLRRQARESESETSRRSRFQLFLIPAILLVLLDSVLSTRRGRRTRAPAAATATALSLLLLLVPLTLRAETGDAADKLYQAARYPEAAAAYQREIQEHADSPRLEYNLGTALMQAGQLEDAVAALERASTTARSTELRFNALYNLGLCYLRQGRDAKSSEATAAFASSAEAYKRALQLRPAELAAKWNYELASQEKSKSSGGGASQQQQNQQQSQQQQQQKSSSLDKRQAEQLLSSAQREERDVQAKKQRENQPERPPAGKDW
ncbi:MAG: tetratricopeptide repeat protein, partial [Gemmatimonadota bacterium]|nr:tetratricopeptide repeat protein [Gemmatimonadota bacterium]